jgi:hypothetical protein
MIPKTTKCCYYVDESGDGVIFDRKGHIVIERPGFSKFFMLGKIEVKNPEILSKELNDLRQTLIKDPYFKGVPSMSPAARKTYLGFHAKDDIPEVRKEVYNLIDKHEIKFFAVVRNLRSVLEYARNKNKDNPKYKYNPNELYDLTVKLLFKYRLHLHDEYTIFFARRGHSDRTRAFQKSLENISREFCEQKGIKRKIKIMAIPKPSHEDPLLQVTDYFLWALQRFYERNEERYIHHVWSKVALIHDSDNIKDNENGVYYRKSNPLILSADNINLNNNNLKEED